MSDELRAVQYEASGNFAAENRVGWAKSTLTRARLLETVRRGVFRITDADREFLASHPQGFAQSDLQALPAWDEYEVKRRASVAIDDDAPVAAAHVTSDPDELLDAAESATVQSVAVDLLQWLRGGEWQFFERTVRRILSAIGYGSEGAKLRTTRSGDGGIDGVINRDALRPDRIYIQAKRFRDTSATVTPSGPSCAPSTPSGRASVSSPPPVVSQRTLRTPRTGAARASCSSTGRSSRS